MGPIRRLGLAIRGVRRFRNVVFDLSSFRGNGYHTTVVQVRNVRDKAPFVFLLQTPNRSRFLLGNKPSIRATAKVLLCGIVSLLALQNLISRMADYVDESRYSTSVRQP